MQEIAFVILSLAILATFAFCRALLLQLIIEINKDLGDHPEYVNQAPYTKGWMIKVELTSSLDQNKELISAEEYSKFVLASAH